MSFEFYRVQRLDVGNLSVYVIAFQKFNRRAAARSSAHGRPAPIFRVPRRLFRNARIAGSVRPCRRLAPADWLRGAGRRLAPARAVRRARPGARRSSARRQAWLRATIAALAVRSGRRIDRRHVARATRSSRSAGSAASAPAPVAASAPDNRSSGNSAGSTSADHCPCRDRRRATHTVSASSTGQASNQSGRMKWKSPMTGYDIIPPRSRRSTLPVCGMACSSSIPTE